MSAPARLAFIAWTVFDHWSASSSVPRCVRLIVKDNNVPSIDAKNVVCHSEVSGTHQHRAGIERRTMTLMSCSLSNHTCTTFMTAFLDTSSSSPLAAETAAEARSFCWSLLRLPLDMGKEPAAGAWRSVLVRTTTSVSGNLSGTAGTHRT